jgi:DNA adenine methylase
MTATLSLPLKWHGGKHYLARHIVGLMPPHVHYVEPFVGGLAVLLRKNPDGVSEVVNDLLGDLTNFWRVLQGEDTFARLADAPDGGPLRSCAAYDVCYAELLAALDNR